MDERKIITLDLTGCKYLGELHERIRISFDFPEWYGANLSAFWDLLWSECDADELIICGVNTINSQLRDYMEKIYLVLDRKAYEREKYRSLYSDIKPFTYRIDS